MRRAIVASTATVSGVVLLLGLKPHDGAAHAAGAISIGTDSGSVTTAPSSPSGGSTTDGQGSAPSSGSTTSPNSGSSGSSTTAPPATTKPSTASGAKTVTGDAAQTRYGPVQLQVTFNGTKITKIDVIDYPTESGRDRQINSYALPVLNQEAMAAQNAQIDVVSGATYTSDGYAESLQSAIDKAKA